jgi:hypothetical protein
MKSKLTFNRIDRPYLNGFECERPDGLNVEVVQCYEGSWDVFICSGEQPVACPVPLPGFRPHEDMPFPSAMKLARQML